MSRAAPAAAASGREGGRRYIYRLEKDVAASLRGVLKERGTRFAVEFCCSPPNLPSDAARRLGAVDEERWGELAFAMEKVALCTRGIFWQRPCARWGCAEGQSLHQNRRRHAEGHARSEH